MQNQILQPKCENSQSALQTGQSIKIVSNQILQDNRTSQKRNSAFTLIKNNPAVAMQMQTNVEENSVENANLL